MISIHIFLHFRRTVKERELHKSYEDHCKKITPEITAIMIDYQEMEVSRLKSILSWLHRLFVCHQDVRKEAHLQDEEILSMMEKAHHDIRKKHPELFDHHLWSIIVYTLGSFARLRPCIYGSFV